MVNKPNLILNQNSFAWLIPNRNITMSIPIDKNYLDGIKYEPLKADTVQLSRENAKDNISCNTELSRYSFDKASGLEQIKTEAEYCKLIDELQWYGKPERTYTGYLCGEDYTKHVFRLDSDGYSFAAPKELWGIQPYCGINDLSSDINRFLKYNKNGDIASLKNCDLPSLKEYTEGTSLIDTDAETIKKFIRCFDYSLEQLDKRYGKYEGLVYRGGNFSSDGKQFWSTSQSFNDTQIRCQRGNELQFHIIKTKNGHKINKFQEEFNSKNLEFAKENEILLPRNSQYRDITGSIDFKEERQKLAEQIVEKLKTTNPNYTIEDIMPKIKVWEEV